MTCVADGDGDGDGTWLIYNPSSNMNSISILKSASFVFELSVRLIDIYLVAAFRPLASLDKVRLEIGEKNNQ